MYGITEKTQESNVTSSLNPGILDNIHLKSAVFGAMSEGKDPVIQITFADDYGSELREVLWEVDEDTVRERAETDNRTHSRNNKELGFVKGDLITGDDAVKKAYQLFNQRSKHIATKFVSEDKIVEALANVSSYAEFGQAYCDLLSEADSSIRVRLKVTLNNKDYSRIPTYPPFIESMQIPKQSSDLKLGQYDRVERVNADESATDPMSVSSTVAGLPDSATF
jgi:hypothetical protein